MKSLSHLLRRAVFAGVLLAAGITAMPARAGLTITPTLLVIEGRQRYADVSLVNSGDKTSSYSVGWRFYKMEDGTGGYQNIASSLTNFDLSQNVVLTPRRVAIPPKAAQRVRLALRLKGEPPAPGDYRAHLEFKQAAVDNPEEKPKDMQRGSQMGVSINVGFSIPVIYRVGESDATAEIGAVTTRLNTRTNKIEAIVPVTKSQSPYGILGHLLVYHDNELVGQVKNANIFAETHQRTYTVSLKTEALNSGTLRVVYKDQDEKKKTIFAEKSIRIGQ